MNRREALAALVALPGTPRISATRLQPDDVIVIECDSRLPLATMKSIADNLKTVWPGRRVLVLDGGTHLKVVSGA